MYKFYLSAFLMLILFTGPAYALESQKAGYQTITIANHKPFRAYVAGPEEAKQGLLLLHGWLGLNREMEIWANQFAVQGYRVMAIDLYNNQVARTPTQARKLMNSVNQQEANAKFRTAIKILAQNGRKVAVLGRSYGANQALHAAAVGKMRISAVVLYYPFGDVVSKKNSLVSIKAPVLGNFASEDFFFDRELREKFVSAAKNEGVKLETANYSARHGFTNIVGKNFDAKEDRLANIKTLGFLAQHLR